MTNLGLMLICLALGGAVVVGGYILYALIQLPRYFRRDR